MSFLVDLVSICSIVGIWPRFIEPYILKTKKLSWSLDPAHRHLKGFTIAQISDLHFNKNTSQKFLDKIVRRTLRQKPDVILFTGDFICYSQIEDEKRLKNFLNRLQAPQGSYCILGNHDHSSYVSLNHQGTFDLMERPNPATAMLRGFRALMRTHKITYNISDRARSLPPHQNLLELLDQTPFTLLENTTVTLPAGLNITGLGEYSVDRCRPKTAFAGYDRRYPGIVMSHNPDTFSKLASYPGEWVLSGHTHGEQIHFPFLPALSKKLARLEFPMYTRGLYQRDGKKHYVSHGVGSPKPFRFCSFPEIVIIKGVI